MARKLFFVPFNKLSIIFSTYSYKDETNNMFSGLVMELFKKLSTEQIKEIFEKALIASVILNTILFLTLLRVFITLIEAKKSMLSTTCK